MVAYADDNTLFTVIPSLQNRQREAELIGHDIFTVLACCTLWGMKYNPSETHSLVINRFICLLSSHSDLVVNRTFVPNCSFLEIA